MKAKELVIIALMVAIVSLLVARGPAAAAPVVAAR